MNKSKIRHPSWIILMMAGSALAATPPATNASPAAPAAPGLAPQSDPFVKKAVTAPAAGWGYDCNLLFVLQAFDVGTSDGNALLQASDDDQSRYDGMSALVKSGKAHLALIMCGTVSPQEQITIEQQEVVKEPVDFIIENGKGIPGDYKDRNIGARFVCKPDDPKSGQLVFFFNRTRLEDFVQQKLTDGAVIGRPQFASSRINQKTTLLPGKEQLLGTAAYEIEDTNTVDSSTTFLFGRMEVVPVRPGLKSKPATVEHEFSLYSMEPDKAEAILNQPQGMDSAYLAVQALVAKNEAKLEHVSVTKTLQDIKTNTDEVTERPYLVSPRSTETRVQETGYTLEIMPRFVPTTSLESLDSTTKWTRYLGQLNGQTIAAGSGAQPVFEVTELSQRFNSSLGEHELMGTFSPWPDTGITGAPVTDRVWLEFVRTTAVGP